MDKPSKVTRNYKKCVICNKRRTPGSNVFLSRLPLDPDRCRNWVKAIGQEDLVFLPIEKLHELKFVCNGHFKPEDFNKSGNRLLSHAIPTLNLLSEPLEEKLLDDFPLHVGQYPKQDITENVLVNIEHNQNIAEPVPSTSTHMCFPVQTSPHQENLSILQDVTNLRGEGLQTGRASKIKPIIFDSLVEPGPSCAEINVQAHNRKKRSNVVQGLSVREEKLLLKLKAQNSTLRKLAKTSLDLDKLENTVLKDLVCDIAKNHKKAPSGKRWTMKTKLWALAIYKRSPKAYRYLAWAMAVPSEKTLQRLLQSVPLEPGIIKKIISKCSDMISGLTEQEKFCALLFDEMALKKRLIYNEASDKIEGYEDYGDERTSKLADHALVFMVQGLKKKFKLPVAYYFVQGTISSARLCVLIKNIIAAVEEEGLNILTTVCDQGPTNVGAINMLKKFCGRSPEDNYFFINESKKVYIMFDIPHLFKSIRNNFFNAGEIVWGEKIGKWSHLVEAEENNRNFLNFPKLNKNVINPTYKIKMRVKFAAHALSNTTSAILKMLAWKDNEKSIEITETADVIKELDNLFDCCNGPSSPKDIKKGIRENVSKNTNHLEMWQYFFKKIETVKFRKSDSHLHLKNVRCINGFKISLKSLGDIWKYLQNQGFKYLNLRQLNQDSLENLFGMIRQHGVTNKNPTCTHFTAALKTCILSGLTAPHSRGSNCEEDLNKFFIYYKNVKHILAEETADEVSVGCPTPTTPAVDSTENVPVLSLTEEMEDFLTDLSSFEEQPVVYVSGYLAAKILKDNACIDCKKNLTVQNPNNEVYNYISYREWWKDKQSLTYPSTDLCQTVYKAKTLFESKCSLHQNDIGKVCHLELNIICDLDWFSCKDHLNVKDILLSKMCLLFIRKFCKIKNESLSLTENDITNKYKKAQTLSKA